LKNLNLKDLILLLLL